MNISSVNHQLQIQPYPPPHLHGQLPGDLFLTPQPVSPPIQHALLGVAFSRNPVGSMSAPPDSVIRRLSAVKRHDTHSKILTAQGLRDRRVRLSVGIARRFFDLQEMLGFDKASETLEWLLGKAADSIETLAKTTKSSPSSSHRCIGNDGLTASLSSMRKEMPRKGKLKKATSVTSMKNMKISNVLARDRSRAQARARARERTLGKFMNSQLRALIGAQFDGFTLDLLTSQSLDGMLPPTAIKHHQMSLIDDELEVAKQSVERARKLSFDLLHHHKELAVASDDVDNFNSSGALLPTEWDYY